jgi:hypothetical protein
MYTMFKTPRSCAAVYKARLFILASWMSWIVQDRCGLKLVPIGHDSWDTAVDAIKF